MAIADPRPWYWTTMRWGDPLYAGLAGSAASWTGAEPAWWQVEQANQFPEPMPLGLLAAAQQTYDGIFGTSGRAEERRREVCAALPPLIRAMIPECKDVRTGEPGERLLGAARAATARLIASGLGIAILLIGIVALVFGGEGVARAARGA